MIEAKVNSVNSFEW
jgi:dynein heavy chain, axonemal